MAAATATRQALLVSRRKRRNLISSIVLLAAFSVLYSLAGKKRVAMLESATRSKSARLTSEDAHDSNTIGEASVTTSSSTTTPDNLNSPSILNCELQLPAHIASVMFHPRSFFEIGLGKPWLATYQKNVQVDFESVEYAEYEFIKETSLPWNDNECHSVHLHLKKCGGTTVHSALKNAHLLGPSSDRFKFTDKHRKQLREIYEHQVNLTLSTIPVFTFIRDPVSRFISGLSQFQTLYFRFPSTHPITVALREENETIPMLERVIESIHSHSSFLNVHLLPQAFEMYKMVDAPGDSKHDIAIQIFDLHDINAVLEAVGVPRDLIQARNTAEKKKKNRNKRRRHPHKHTIETSVLTPELKRKICNLYAMDVKMIRETGIGVTSCEDEEYGQ